METKEIVNNAIKNGAKIIKGLSVRNVLPTTMENYVRLGINLKESVPAYVVTENGDFQKGESHIIFSSTYAVGANLRDDDDAAFAVNHLINHPEAMAMILAKAKIDILQIEVKAGDVYVNPFSENGEETVFDHDVIINNIIKIELSDFGKDKLDKLADKMLGF